MWLFQEAERMSSDRLFRVRAKQPTSRSEPKKDNGKSANGEMALKSVFIAIGDYCIFKSKPANEHKVNSVYRVRQRQANTIQRQLCGCV